LIVAAGWVSDVTDTSDRNKRDRAARRIKVACAVLVVICFLGIVGGGVCERIAMSSPPYADPASGQTAPIDFKGQARFVQPMIAKYCGLSVWIMVVAAGGTVALSGVLYFVFGRLPHE